MSVRCYYCNRRMSRGYNIYPIIGAARILNPKRKVIYVHQRCPKRKEH